MLLIYPDDQVAGSIRVRCHLIIGRGFYQLFGFEMSYKKLKEFESFLLKWCVFKYDFCLVVKILFTKRTNEDGNICVLFFVNFCIKAAELQRQPIIN